MTGKIVRDMFNLTYIILDRDDLQSIDAFGSAILDEDHNDLDDDMHDPDTNADTVGACSRGLYCLC
jgi:hypothetical protein